MATCSSYCSSLCTGTCTAVCASSCRGGCKTSCTSSCGSSCYGSNCSGGCTGCTGGCGGCSGCSGTCKTGCYGSDCSGGCTGCTGGCGGSCQGCSGTCEGTCEGKCNHACYSDCDSGCTADCASSCTGTCKNTCEGTCNDTCSGTCEGACVTTCTGTSAQYIISGVVSPAGSGTISGTGTYALNSTYKLTAVRNSPSIYGFDKWDDGSKSIYASGTATSDVTRTAYFKSAYWVITYKKGDAPSGADYMDEGAGGYAKNLAANKFTWADHKFTGWLIGTTVWAPGESYGPVSAGTYVNATAQWEEMQKYNVFVGASTGGTVTGGGQYYVGATATINAVPSIGYEFDYWELNGQRITAGATYQFTVESEVSFVAYFKVKTYLIRYRKNKGETYEESMSYYDQYKEHDVAFMLLDVNHWSFAGYTPQNWNTLSDGSGTTYSSKGWYYNNAALELWCQWTANSYTVKYHYNDGTSRYDAMNQVYDQSYNLPSDPTWEGRVFLGWYTAATGGTKKTASDTYKTASNTDMWAHWARTFTIRTGAGPNGRAYPESQQCLEESEHTIHAVADDGYEFDYWELNGDVVKGAGKDYTFTVTGDASYFAYFKIKTYRIRYIKNRGETYEEWMYYIDEYKDHNQAWLLKDPRYTFTLAGYTPSTWNTRADGSGTIYGPGSWYYNNEDIELWNQWTANQYKAHFWYNNGTQYGTTITQTYDQNYIIPNFEPEYAEHRFLGWYTSAKGGTKITADVKFRSTSDVDLYAHWASDKVTLTLVSSDPAHATIECDGEPISASSWQYLYNATANFSVTPAEGYRLSKWGNSSAPEKYQLSRSVLMDSDKGFVAFIEESKYDPRFDNDIFGNVYYEPRGKLLESGEYGYNIYRGINLNPLQTGATCKGNCTWYAWGRTSEICGFDLYNECPATSDAAGWFTHPQILPNWGRDPVGSVEPGYEITPALGAIVCWGGGSGEYSGLGHVGIIEAINDETITVRYSSHAPGHAADSSELVIAQTSFNRSDFYVGATWGGLSLQGVIYNPYSGTPQKRKCTITTGCIPDDAGIVTVNSLSKVTVEKNDPVRLRFYDRVGHTFNKWWDGVGGTSGVDRIYTVTSSLAAIAYFDGYDPETHVLIKTKVNDASAGIVTGGGYYRIGEEVRLTAVPNEGYYFNVWSTGENTSEITFEATKSETYTATFSNFDPSEDPEPGPPTDPGKFATMYGDGGEIWLDKITINAYIYDYDEETKSEDNKSQPAMIVTFVNLDSSEPGEIIEWPISASSTISDQIKEFTTPLRTNNICIKLNGNYDENALNLSKVQLNYTGWDTETSTEASRKVRYFDGTQWTEWKDA